MRLEHLGARGGGWQGRDGAVCWCDYWGFDACRGLPCPAGLLCCLFTLAISTCLVRKLRDAKRTCPKPLTKAALAPASGAGLCRSLSQIFTGNRRNGCVLWCLEMQAQSLRFLLRDSQASHSIKSHGEAPNPWAQACSALQMGAPTPVVKGCVRPFMAGLPYLV